MTTLLTKRERDEAHQGKQRAIQEMERMVPKGFHLVELSDDEISLILSMTKTHKVLTATAEKQYALSLLELKLQRRE